MANSQPKNRIPEKVSAELIVFADCLNPTPMYIKQGKERVQAVFSALQKEPLLSISRSYIGGSVGKSTSIIYPDFDCVVFMNKKYPPLTPMVEEFEKILREKAVELQIVVSSIKNSRITLSLEFLNGVEMDLLPATNFSQNDPEEQYKLVLGKMAADPRQYLGYSSSLAETQLQFMKNQSSATHQLVRICKYWYKLCTFDLYIYGGSSIIEILCVTVALDLDPVGEGTSFQMLQAFKEFLKKVAGIDKLKLAFYREGNKFIRVASRDFNLPKNKSHFHNKIIELKNFIIEPANPYNNLAKNIKDDTLKRLQDFSKKMLSRLEKLESTESNDFKTLSPDGKDIQLVHYDKLFEPFIMCLKEYYPNSAIPTRICIDYLYQNYSTAHVNAEVRNKDFFEKNKAAKSVYKTVMNNLLFLIRGKALRTLKNGLSFTDGVADIGKLEDVKSAVQMFVQANFGVKKLIDESSINKVHDEYTVTLSIPYKRLGKMYAVRFSMQWSS